MNNKLPLPGTRLGNFLVQQQQPVQELNLTAVTLQHEPTGARLLHLACDDPNNVFAVGFRTPPPDSTGVSHILEHTVLCGSQKYPVRDPFFAMLKRSLNTFMNAMTAADWTLYPVASMNRKDFYNLMGIYLDAAFFPLLREQDFLQEGHRLDFADPNDPDSLMIKGVVFNEMKGAMADPSSLLGRRLNAELFPTTCYGENSGGEPLVIPELTWEQLCAFHKSYYHPSNSWIFTYGDLPIEEHLQHIEELALSRFERQDVVSEIPLEQRLTEPQRSTQTFPVGAGDALQQSSMVQMAWLTCPIEDTFERAATGILTNLLLGNPAAPLYQALIESGLGRNLSPGTGYHDDYRDTYLSAGLQGTDPEKMPEIEALILDTLARVAREGFPQERIDAALHQYEFANREVSGDQYPYGLGLMMRLFGPWLHAGDPFSALMIGQNLDRLREAAADPEFFPRMIRRHLLDNPHRVTLLLRPDPEHGQREEQAFADYLLKVRQKLDDAAVADIKAKAAELQRSQEAEEDTSCLPILELADIEVEEQATPFHTQTTAGCKTYWFAQPTNGITYLNLQFDVSGLDNSLRPYLPIFCTLLPQIGAAGHDYLAMSRRITAATGGIRLGTNLLESPVDLDSMRPFLDVKCKALDRNQTTLCEILIDMLTAPDFSDISRLRTVIGQVRTSMENSIPGAGHSFAARAAAASLTPTAALREEWSGMTQTRIIQQASDLDEQGMIGLAKTFEAIAAELLVAARATASITAEEAAHLSMTEPLAALLAALPDRSALPSDLPSGFTSRASATGWHYNLPVAYVSRVFRTVPYTHPDAPALMVLAKLLRADFLHREIREKGGAYGGMAGYNADGGLFSMLSYRDPHLQRTLDVYRQAVEWACQGEFSDEMIKQSILSAFAELDRPLSPGSRGYREFVHQQQGLTHDMLQTFRSGIIAMDQNKLTRAAQTYLQQGFASSAVGILAGDEMFSKAEAVLKQLDMQMKRLGSR
ncbi:MAG: insulinase family protein [Desulfuromonadales bacterium]|nr:insulinase family protein [Desulfuromonadales bacterium]